MEEEFQLFLIALGTGLFTFMTVSSIIFIKRLNNDWKRLTDVKEVEITNL